MLESVDTTQQQFGRFTFIGAFPFARIQVFKDKLMIRENDLMDCIEGDPVHSISQYMKKFRPALEDEALPLANGGLVGYFNYEVVSTFDRVRNLSVGPDELLGQFMLCRVLVVIDSLRNRARLIYFADVEAKEDEDETLADIYARSQDKLAALVKTLEGPVGAHPATAPARGEKLDFLKKYGKAPQRFIAAIQKAKEHIFAGDIFQVVPSHQFRAKITPSRPFISTGGSVR
jgi:anthranilate synthase component 1